MLFKMFLITFIFLAFKNSFAFNGEKCKRFLDKGTLTSGAVFLTTSTFQYVSSTGACSLIGKLDHDSKVFVADNYNQLKVDFARGYGEYAMTFASMYGCDLEVQYLFPIAIKRRFSELSDDEGQIERSHSILVGEIVLNPLLNKRCVKKAT